MNQIHSDDTLKQLALQAQKSSPNSPERQRCLQRLVTLIQRAKSLGHPRKSSYLENLENRDLYKELYNEALQRTLIKVCKDIDRYKPRFALMRWVNGILKFAFLNVERERYGCGMKYIPHTLQGEKLIYSLEDLDEPQLDLHSDEATDAQQFRDFLKDDPEQKLQNTRMRKRPEITFQLVACTKVIEGLTWEQLSELLNVPRDSLYSFFDRNFKKLKPYFMKYLCP